MDLKKSMDDFLLYLLERCRQTIVTRDMECLPVCDQTFTLAMFSLFHLILPAPKSQSAVTNQEGGLLVTLCSKSNATTIPGIILNFFYLPYQRAASALHATRNVFASTFPTTTLLACIYLLYVST
jgi:hypothetical protein